jgi:hypothetical protein
MWKVDQHGNWYEHIPVDGALGIEDILRDPIHSRQDAESFLRIWMHDGFGSSIDAELFEIRTVLEPEEFAQLLIRIVELNDVEAWWDEPVPDQEMDDLPGFVIKELLSQLNAEWDEDLREPDLSDDDEMFPLFEPDPDIRAPLGSIGGEEDPPYAYIAREGAPYENWGSSQDQDGYVTSTNWDRDED